MEPLYKKKTILFFLNTSPHPENYLLQFVEFPANLRNFCLLQSRNLRRRRKFFRKPVDITVCNAGGPLQKS